MHRGELFNGFELNDDNIIDQQVDSQALVEMHSIVFEGHLFLVLHLQSSAL